jgi:hypothetical protein
VGQSRKGQSEILTQGRAKYSTHPKAEQQKKSSAGAFQTHFIGHCLIRTLALEKVTG